MTIMIFWGICSTGMALVTDVTTFVTVRFLLVPPVIDFVWHL